MATLSFSISSKLINNYDRTGTVARKVVVPLLDGLEIGYSFSRLDTETDVDSKTAVKTVLTADGYVWDIEA